MAIFLYKDAETRLERTFSFLLIKDSRYAEKGGKKTFMRISDETYHIL